MEQLKNTSDQSIFAPFQQFFKDNNITTFQAECHKTSNITFDLESGKFRQSDSYEFGVVDAKKLNFTEIPNLKKFYDFANSQGNENFDVLNYFPTYQAGTAFQNLDELKNIITEQNERLNGQAQENRNQIFLTTHPILYMRAKDQIKQFVESVKSIAKVNILCIEFYGPEGFKAMLEPIVATLPENVSFYLFPQSHNHASLMGFDTVKNEGGLLWIFLNKDGNVTLAKQGTPDNTWVDLYNKAQTENASSPSETVATKEKETVKVNESDINNLSKELENFNAGSFSGLSSQFNEIEFNIRTRYTIDNTSTTFKECFNFDFTYREVKKIRPIIPKVFEIVEKLGLSSVIKKIPKESPKKLTVQMVKEIIEKAGDILKPENLEFTAKKTFNGGKYSANYTLVNTIKSLSVEQLTKLSKLQKEIGRTDDVSLVLVPKFKVGDKFLPIPFARDLTSDAECLITHNSGEVVLMDLWATWCGPCQKPMAHNNEMLEKNKEKWSGKVRILGLGLDQREALQKRIEEKNWKLVEHYYMDRQKYPESGICSEMYGDGGIPHVFVINKFGTICFKGHPSETNLEELINKCIDETEDSETKVEATISASAKVSPNAMKNLHNFYRNNLKTLNYRAKMSVAQEQVFKFNKDLVSELSRETSTMDYSLRVAEAEKVKAELLPEGFTVNKGETLETVSIQLGDKCHQCHVDITNFAPQYWCNWCKVSFCTKCMVYDKSKTDLSRAPHNHNLVYINVKNKEGLNDIDVYKFGNNLVYQPDKKEFNDQQSGCCNGCGGGIDGLRYICLSCRLGAPYPGGFCDFCEDCLAALNDPSSKNHQKVLDSCKNEKHDPNSHVYLVLSFDTGYYDF